MNRRTAFLPLALVAALSVVLAACNATPAATNAPALTDPRDIVAKGAASMADVSTFEFTTSFRGSLDAPGVGAFDLSPTTIAGAVDVRNGAARLSLDAPTILGTRLEAIVVGGSAYYKVAGALAAMLPGSADRYTKVAVPALPAVPGLPASGAPLAAADMAALLQQVQAGLALLPAPPTKAADERCGDLECYHVTLGLTGDQLQALDPSANLTGTASVDVWTRKLDYRPAKISIGVVSPDAGSFGMTTELRYDVEVSIAAPPPDQIAP